MQTGRGQEPTQKRPGQAGAQPRNGELLMAPGERPQLSAPQAQAPLWRNWLALGRDRVRGSPRLLPALPDPPPPAQQHTFPEHLLCAREGAGLFHERHLIVMAAPHRGHHGPHGTGEEAETWQDGDSLKTSE